METTADGGCLCGAVRYVASGPPKWTAYCHCHSCRRQTGAPVTAYTGFETAQVRFTHGAPKSFSSSPGVDRLFCGHCGTPLAYRGARWPTETHLLTGTFDDPAPFAPKVHVFAGERVAWLHISEPPLPPAAG